MKIVQINATCGKGSTGKIVDAVGKLLDENHIENYILYSAGHSDRKNAIKYTTRRSVKFHALSSRIFGNYGFDNKAATKKLIAHLKTIQPDIIHIHNIHSHDCNLDELMAYIRENPVKVFWTFHDCWAFTGYCPHFDMVGCEKWKTECNHCPQKREYSWFFDGSSRNFQKKTEALRDLDLTVVTPSHWMENLVKESFLRDYPVKVIPNGIDLSVFRPENSDFREKYNCRDKFIILGVAFQWGSKKGLDVFLELAKRLDDNYQIVLVGTNAQVDKLLPDNIISIHRTNDQKELAQIYTAADLFVNPTREETYPTVNMEAVACGTPVLTFDTGGSREMLDETCGSVVPKNDVQGLYAEILRIRQERPYLQEDCLKKSRQFDMQARFREYVELYKE